MVAALGAVTVARADAPPLFFNGFETDTSGWHVFEQFGAQYVPTRVSSGTNGVPSHTGAFHAEAAGPFDADNDGGSAATNWGGYGFAFPAGGYHTQVDVYLDVSTAASNDTRFDFSSAISEPGPGTCNVGGAGCTMDADCAPATFQFCKPPFRRDFVFNGGFYNDGPDATGNGARYVISASNNAGRSGAFPKNPGRDPFTITATGWYTLRHRFFDNGSGVLAVELSILDGSGNVIHTWAPLSDPTDLIGTTVGGNRYGWFAANEFAFLAIDNSLRAFANACGPRFVATTGTDTSNDCLDPGAPCLTVQHGIDQACSGDTVNVAAGTYTVTGLVNVNKTVTLLGAQAGVNACGRSASESILSNSQGMRIGANDVVVNGFTVRDSTNTAFTGYGIWMDPSASVTGTQLLNNIITDNIVGVGLANAGPSQALIQHNAFETNNVSGPASGTGIYTDEFVGGVVTNVLVDANCFDGNDDAGIDVSVSDPTKAVTKLEISGNTFNNNGRAVFLLNTNDSTIHNNSITNSTLAGSGAIRIFGGVNDLDILNNDIDTGAGWGIRITTSADPNSDVVINENNIVNFTDGGLFVAPAAHTGTVNAECNWWGDASGPAPVGTGQLVDGDADFTPWLVAPSPAPASGSGTCTGGLATTTTTETSTTTTEATTTTTETTTTTTETTTTTTVSPTTTTTTSTTLPLCGNGFVDSGEQCDPPGSFDPAQCPQPGSPTGAFVCQSTCGCCVPTGAETGNCSDMIDNDCDGKIDCTDADCSPASCQGGSQNGLDCSNDAGITACTTGGGSCACPAIQRDPTTITFGPIGAGLDRINSHGRVTIPGSVDVRGSDVAWLLTKDGQHIYEAVLPAGAMKGNIQGTRLRYNNRDAKVHGGIYKATITVTRGHRSYGYTLHAYGDISGATNPHMEIQFYIGDRQTPALYSEVWTRTRSGWRAHPFQ